MYKSKLQEMCQQRKWGAPKYITGIRDGPDHNPLFKASVSLNNGMVFESDASAICKTSKNAQNEAAKLAFLHFNPDFKTFAGGSQIEETYEGPEVHSNASGVEIDSSTPTSDLDAETQKTEDSDRSIEIYPITSKFNNCLQYQYKSKLQSYAQRKHIKSPMYSVKREGPPHALCFKATVTVHGHSFDSPGHHNTLKEAEHAAAKFALMSLSLDGFQEIDSGYYKNLLQELAQSEGFILPTYKTITSGPPHESTFTSTVEVEGQTFHGISGPSKKHAEINAAKVAYTVFLERRKCKRNAKCNSLGLPKDETPEFDPSEDALAIVNDTQETIDHGDPSVSFSILKLEDKGSEEKKKTMGGTGSYLLCNRVRVYTCIPDIMTFPLGTIVLPIGEEKWVVVSLEFPNEKVI